MVSCLIANHVGIIKTFTKKSEKRRYGKKKEKISFSNKLSSPILELILFFEDLISVAPEVPSVSLL